MSLVCDKATKVAPDKAMPPTNEKRVEIVNSQHMGALLKYKSYVDGKCCSNLALTEDAMSFSVVKLAMASYTISEINKLIAKRIQKLGQPERP